MMLENVRVRTYLIHKNIVIFIPVWVVKIEGFSCVKAYLLVSCFSNYNQSTALSHALIFAIYMQFKAVFWDHLKRAKTQIICNIGKSSKILQDGLSFWTTFITTLQQINNANLYWLGCLKVSFWGFLKT